MNFSARFSAEISSAFAAPRRRSKIEKQRKRAMQCMARFVFEIAPLRSRTLRLQIGRLVQRLDAKRFEAKLAGRICTEDYSKKSRIHPAAFGSRAMSFTDCMHMYGHPEIFKIATGIWAA